MCRESQDKSPPLGELLKSLGVLQTPHPQYDPSIKLLSLSMWSVVTNGTAHCQKQIGDSLLLDPSGNHHIPTAQFRPVRESAGFSMTNQSKIRLPHRKRLGGLSRNYSWCVHTTFGIRFGQQAQIHAVKIRKPHLEAAQVGLGHPILGSNHMPQSGQESDSARCPALLATSFPGSWSLPSRLEKAAVCFLPL